MNNSYTYPVIREVLNIGQKAKIYTKHDIHVVYQVSQVKEGDGHILAFQKRYCLFWHTVLLLRSLNVQVNNQGYFNNTVQKAVDKFAFPYCNYVFPYCNSLE